MRKHENVERQWNSAYLMHNGKTEVTDRTQIEDISNLHFFILWCHEIEGMQPLTSQDWEYV